MGPLEIAPRTQYEPGSDWNHGMFPPREVWHRLEKVSQLRMPRRGDISARSAPTLHRGTANLSPKPRPVVILGVDALGGHEERHDMVVTQAFWDSLDVDLRRHLHVRIVPELAPHEQRYTIEGIVMGEA